MSEQLKSSVLAKCGELAPTEAEYHVHPKYNVRRVRQKFTIYADWGSVEFKESTPHDDDVWPLAAQILGIGRFSIPDDIWEDNIKEGLKEAYADGYKQGRLDRCQEE